MGMSQVKNDLFFLVVNSCSFYRKSFYCMFFLKMTDNLMRQGALESPVLEWFFCFSA